MLTLSLEKASVETPKLQLSLKKGARFTVKVEWRCDAKHSDDVDVQSWLGLSEQFAGCR